MTTPPRGLFSASAAPDPAGERRVRNAPGRALDPEERLYQAMDEVDDLLADLDEQERSEPLEPALRAQFERITSDPKAPLEFQSMNRRVHAGFTTWEAIWADPQATPGGQQLIAAAVGALLAEAGGTQLGVARPDDSGTRRQR